MSVAEHEPRRVLIVANRTAATPTLMNEVRHRAAGGPHRFALGRVVENLSDGRRDRFRVAVNDLACLRPVEQLARPTNIGDDDRRAAGERFDPGVGEPFG